MMKSKWNQIIARRQVRKCEEVTDWMKSWYLSLIETSDSKETDLIFCKIQFLYKSINNFLNITKARSWISQYLNKDDFVSVVCLMQATLLQLKTVKIYLLKHQFHDFGRLKCKIWFNDIWSIIVEFMQYARMTEKKTKFA